MTSSTRMLPESRLVIRSSSASSISGCSVLISLRTQLSLWRTSAMAWSTGEMEACAVPHAARGQKNVDPKVAFPFSRPACLLLGRPARANPQLRASFAPDYVTAPSSPSLLLRANVLIFWAISRPGDTNMFRWLRQREGKRIAAEVGEPPENRGAEPPDQIAELPRIIGGSQPLDLGLDRSAD